MSEHLNPTPDDELDFKLIMKMLLDSDDTAHLTTYLALLHSPELKRSLHLPALEHPQSQDTN